ncbi:hypothetical protein V501_01468 [Pseudogymnoascus sp. VKM F-4519 (FW-2642)]|nr:hypothetical protein V501_01468 [Pseudogymnoascus sp. VKM F-4519 (FW-2642)]
MEETRQTPCPEGKEMIHTHNEHATQTCGSYISEELKAYIVQRHGTLELDPLPSYLPQDPLNWPLWMKNMNMLMVAFHTMMATFSAAAIIPAYSVFAEKYGISIHQASYLTSVQILTMGIFPQIWSPIAVRFGRKPIFLVSVLGACICNIGGCFCHTYATQMVTRILNTIFICPPLGIGSGVVTDIFFRHERAQKMGWWTLMTTIGTPLGPFLYGFLIQRAPYQWMFGIFAIANFCQFLGYLFLGSETMGFRTPTSSTSTSTSTSPAATIKAAKPASWADSFKIRRINPAPFTLTSFLSYLNLALHPSVLIPAIAYALVFCYANIAIIVMMPLAVGEKFHLDAQGVGLQYLAIILGSILGEQFSGPASDWFLARYSARAGVRVATQRLWLAYPGFAAVVAGLVVWGVQLQNAEDGVWNVTPMVGAAIASFGNQIITTTLITYAVDSCPLRSSEVGLFVNLLRQIWGFIGPFYIPVMFENLNFAATAGVYCAIIAVAGWMPVAVLHWLNRTRKVAREANIRV